MMKFASILVLFFNLVSANDEKSNINFTGIEYPISYTSEVSEKTYILYQTPLSEKIDSSFNAIAVQGLVSDKNVSFELWIPQEEDPDTKEVKYSIINGVSKIYPNGRFWCRFDLSLKIEKFKFVVINNGVKSDKFKITIYEIQTANLFKKKDQKDSKIEIDKGLSLPDPLPFKLIRRAEWGAKSPTSSYTQHTPLKITIHNTAGNYPTTLEDAITEIQVIQEYHQEAKGWIDIGYHFLIDPLGDIFEGRPILVIGAHVANKNTDNVGISIMGNYHPPVNNDLTQKTIDSIITLVKHIKDKYKISKTNFFGHRDLAETDCPGDNIYSKMSYLKAKIFDEKEDSVIVDVDLGNEELNNKIIKSIYNW
ncbi:MAG: peptidoglycan recognition protein family protein [Elusimicrobiota bacterium]